MESDKTPIIYDMEIYERKAKRKMDSNKLPVCINGVCRGTKRGVILEVKLISERNIGTDDLTNILKVHAPPGAQGYVSVIS